MSKYIEITLKMEFMDDVDITDRDTLIDALKHFGEYNDTIEQIKEVEE
jgi:hypothetical protein